MNPWVSLGVVVAVGGASALITYLITRLRMERRSADRLRAAAEAMAALETERANFERAARGIEQNARREALDQFIADLRVEERRYVRTHRVLFAHRKSLVLEERIFFRNLPLSGWVEHEVEVEEGADLDALAKTMSVFNAIEGGAVASRTARQLLSRAV